MAISVTPAATLFRKRLPPNLEKHHRFNILVFNQICFDESNVFSFKSLGHSNLHDPSRKPGSPTIKTKLGGETSNIFYFHPYLGKIPNLTSLFFKWVVQPPTRKTAGFFTNDYFVLSGKFSLNL